MEAALAMAGPAKETGATGMKTVVATAGAGAASQARIEQSFRPGAPIPPQSLWLPLRWRIGQKAELQQAGVFAAESASASVETAGRSSAPSAAMAASWRNA